MTKERLVQKMTRIKFIVWALKTIWILDNIFLVPFYNFTLHNLYIYELCQMSKKKKIDKLKKRLKWIPFLNDAQYGSARLMPDDMQYYYIQHVCISPYNPANILVCFSKPVDERACVRPDVCIYLFVSSKICITV